MIKVKQIEVNGKKYSIHELKVKQIIDFQKKLVEIGKDAGIEQMLDFFLLEISDIKKDDLMEFSFSEIEEAITAVFEVNKSFFSIPESIGLGEVAEKIKKQIKESIIKDLSQVEEKK